MHTFRKLPVTAPKIAAKLAKNQGKSLLINSKISNMEVHYKKVVKNVSVYLYLVALESLKLYGVIGS
tara:strand:+ start:220 stop:420 length:201 start_codon:yes stop_codon:yes gene_type:complete